MNRSTTDDPDAVHRGFAVNLAVACFAVAAGCAGRAPAPASPNEAMVRVGRPCPALSSGAAPSLVFIEVADARIIQPSDDLAAAIEAPLPIRGIGGLLASMGEPASVPWGGCIAEPCESQVRTLIMTPQYRGAEPQRVELTVQLAPPEGSAEPPRTTQLETKNQEPVQLRFDDGVPSRPVAWIVTPYLMSSREDLKNMRACKMAEAQSASP